MASVKRELKCLYYQLSATPNIVAKINDFFKNFDSYYNKTESIENFGFYISDIVKKESHVLFTIAKVDTSQEIKVDDIEKQNRTIVDKEDTQGLATDAQFLYSFSDTILVQKRGQSQTNLEELKMILSRKVNIHKDKFKFALVKDKEGLLKLDKLNQVHNLVFNLAIPKNLSLFEDQIKDTNVAIELAKKLSGDSIEVKIHGENLKKRGIKETIDLLLQYRESQNVKFKSLSIYGDNELIDLVKHKLSYYKKIDIEELKNKDIYDFLEEAYLAKEKYLQFYKEEEE